MTGHDSFGRLLQAEGTKLRTMPGMVWSLLAAAGALVAIAVLISSGSPGTFDKAPYVDQFRFVHQPLTGDGRMVARVRDQADTNPWAMAGIMIKTDAVSGAPYAAILTTPGHGVRMQANFTTDLAGSPGTGSRWLKLDRSGTAITGYESADGSTWRKVGTVTLAALPQTVQVGMFVTSPGATRLVPMRPASAMLRPGKATFEKVHITSAPPLNGWTSQEVGRQGALPRHLEPEMGGRFTINGSGDIIGQTDDGSRVIAAIAGTSVAILPIITLGVLAITSEYHTGMIRTSLVAVPKRGRILAAKAIVLVGVVFTITLVAVTAALFAIQPLLGSHGYKEPIYPDPSLTNSTVLRVTVGTAIILALFALLGLGVGSLTRRSAPAITIVTAATLLPLIVMPMLPPAVGTSVQRWAPTAGLGVQQVYETDDAFLVPWAGEPWTGLAILAGYVTIILGIGHWLLRRRDA